MPRDQVCSYKAAPGAQEEKEEGRKDGYLPTPQGQPSRRKLAAAHAHKVLLSARVARAAQR